MFCAVDFSDVGSADLGLRVYDPCLAKLDLIGSLWNFNRDFAGLVDDFLYSRVNKLVERIQMLPDQAFLFEKRFLKKE